MTADTAGDRKQLLVRRIIDARRNDETVVFEADEGTVKYDNRTLRVELDNGEHDRLEGLLDAYHVFKIKQPETRKAAGNVVYLSAVTDAKHAADFIEALFLTVYDADDGYELQTAA